MSELDQAVEVVERFASMVYPESSWPSCGHFIYPGLCGAPAVERCQVQQGGPFFYRCQNHRVEIERL